MVKSVYTQSGGENSKYVKVRVKVVILLKLRTIVQCQSWELKWQHCQSLKSIVVKKMTVLSKLRVNCVM